MKISIGSILPLLTLLFLQPTSLQAWGDADYGEGCCVPNSMIVKLSKAYDVEGQVVLTMMERLAEEAFSDLRLLQITPARACDVYSICNEIPEEFFRVLLKETIERKKAVAQNSQQKNAFIFTFVTAIIAFLGLFLGAINTLRNFRKRD